MPCCCDQNGHQMNKTWIRRLKPEDLDKVAALNTLAFGGTEEASIVRHLHADHDSLLSLVTHRGDELVGHIEFFRILIGGKPSAVGLGPMSVLPELQGRGIGSSLAGGLPFFCTLELDTDTGVVFPDDLGFDQRPFAFVDKREGDGEFFSHREIFSGLDESTAGADVFDEALERMPAGKAVDRFGYIHAGVPA